MKSKLFLLPGFRFDCEKQGYQPLLANLKNKYSIIECDINWKYTTIDNWVEEFLNKYKVSNIDTVLGFSYGAMTALLASQKAPPKNLILCSMSPFFSEDIAALPNKWIKKTGPKRISVFLKTHFNDISKNDNTNYYLTIGDKELSSWPNMKSRFEKTKDKLSPKQILIIPDNKHEFNNSYVTLVINLLQKVTL